MLKFASFVTYMVALAVLCVCVFIYVGMHACGRQRSNLGAFEETFILFFCNRISL